MPQSVNTADEYEFVNHEETALSPEVLANIRAWLEPTDYLAESGEFRRHLSSQAPGTGLWICHTDEYRKWHDSPDHGSLWIKGVPGAGKSVTAASIIHHLRTTEEHPVLFFFFRNIVAANFSPRALIQDWLAQLVPFSPKLQFALQQRLENKLAEISDDDLIQLFLDGVSVVPKLYCVADALDEMSVDNRPFLNKLNGLATFRPRSLKLLITSRPKQYLQSALRDSSIVHISLQQQLVDADIASYLNHRFDVAPISDAQRKAKQQVVDMVARRSEGLFLYAKLTMDQVEASMLSGGHVDLADLENSLPVGLEDIYTRLLAKQREDHGVSVGLQVIVIEAVTHASRPLRLYELASLTQCVCPDTPAPKGFKALIATCCGPLVEILEDETLQVIHHSFTEFLRGDSRQISDVSPLQFPIINSVDAHMRMTINCLRYLQSGSLLAKKNERPKRADPLLDEDPESDGDPEEENARFDYREARLQYPFLSYAVENWLYHAGQYDSDGAELLKAIEKFLDSANLAFRRWLVLQWGAKSTTLDAFPTALHIAAYAGMSRFVIKLLERGFSLSARDSQGRIPLHWAAAVGHADIASLLIQHGSEADAADNRGVKPIHVAALKNHAAVVTVLLEAGVEPGTVKTKENHGGYLKGGEKITSGECAILYASQGGHTETVMAMIPFCNSKVLEQLLCECCRFGRSDAVMAILDRSNVSPDAMFSGATALYLACGSTNPACVKALLDRGADPQKMSTWFPRRTRHGGPWQPHVTSPPLHELIVHWREDNDTPCREILKMLIRAGANLEQVDGDGLTALLLASGAAVGRRGPLSLSIPAIPALLEAGANVHAVTYKGGDTALHAALRQPVELETVKLLVEYGADPKQLGTYGSVFECCLSGHHGWRNELPSEETINTVQYLLNQGAEPGKDAVCEAMQNNIDIFRLLLSRCPDESVKAACWFGLPSVYDNNKFVVLLDILLDTGINIETRNSNNYGSTLLLNCINSEDRVSALRQRGAKIEAVDDRGNNALHALAMLNTPRRAQMEKLVAEGTLDPLTRNKDGNTLLHHVAAWHTWNEETDGLVRWLIGLGIDVNSVNNAGSSVLHTFLNLYRSDPNELILAINILGGEDKIKFDLRDKDGMAPLHLLAMRSASYMAALVSCGADPTYLTEDAQNVLHLSCRARRGDVVCMVAAQYSTVDVNQKDTFGRTPLHYACASGQAESVATLLARGADVLAIDTELRTPLHACAEFKTEQKLYETRGLAETYMRGPPADKLRPGFKGMDRGFGTTWYKDSYGEAVAYIRRAFFPGVTTIVKMLLEAKADVGARDKNMHTPLDRALVEGCSEFVEVFATDDALFAEATKHFEGGETIAKNASQSRKYMKAQMALIRPRSALPVLDEDEASRQQVLDSPELYLALLTAEDAAVIIKAALAANPDALSHYGLVKELMQPRQLRHLEVVERVPELIQQYSSHAMVRDKMAKAKETDRYYYNREMTALQLACGSAEPNLLMLKVLVEKIGVNIDARGVGIRTNPRDKKERQLVPGGTALHVLAAGRHWWQVDGLRYLIAKGADVNARDKDGRTPLHTLGRRKNHANNHTWGFWRLDVVRILLDNGADPNSLDDEGLTPLSHEEIPPEIMAELLQRGADPNAGSMNPLFQVIADQNLASLETLLDHGVGVDTLHDRPDHLAVRNELVKGRRIYPLLLASDAPSYNNQVRKSVPLVQTLVARGASLYLPLNDDETLIHVIFEFAQYEILDGLLQEPYVSNLDLNRRDQRRRTVVMASCRWNGTLPGYAHRHWDSKATAICIRMLEHKADATLVDAEGKTALHHLLENPSVPDDVVLQFLNRKEVAPTLLRQDTAGFSPFHYALAILRPTVCHFLLSNGANLLEPDPNGLTALHHIALQCFESARYSGRKVELPKDFFDQCLTLWELFLAKGGSINSPDNGGNTPLLTYLSSIHTSSDLNRKLPACHVAHYDNLFPPDSGVDVFAVNREGETALHVITKRDDGHYGEHHDKLLFEAMMAKGLDPLQEDLRGRSALDVASACEKHDIVALLGRKSVQMGSEGT